MCIFCELKDQTEKHLYDDEFVYAIYDNFPASPGHALIISKRHIETVFDATREEFAAIGNALAALKKINDDLHHPDGYNVGINCGKFAGQTVMHLHVHLIPRYQGDTDRPRGGVRGIIPGKQEY